MKTYTVQHTCGCCHSDIQFENEEGIKAAFKEAGLGSSVILKNNKGTVLHNVDTFYGYSEEGIKEEPPLARLVNQLKGWSF